MATGAPGTLGQVRRRLVFLLLSIVATAIVLGLVFAGSPTTLANGVSIDGVDVGGLEAADARALLQKRSSALASKPVVFVAGGKRFSIEPLELGVEPDWKAAVDSARRQGDGFGPLRGFKRLDVQVFGADVTPPIRVLTACPRSPRSSPLSRQVRWSSQSHSLRSSARGRISWRRCRPGASTTSSSSRSR